LNQFFLGLLSIVSKGLNALRDTLPGSSQPTYASSTITYSHEQVLELIHKLFSDENAPEAIRLLEEYRPTSTSDGTFGKLQYYIVKRSHGDIEQLKYWIEWAKEDWRDLIIAEEEQKVDLRPSWWKEK
jgi:hypothetical protein